MSGSDPEKSDTVAVYNSPSEKYSHPNFIKETEKKM